MHNARKGNLFSKIFFFTMYLILFMTVFNFFALRIVNKKAINTLTAQQTLYVHSELNTIDNLITHIKNLTYQLENAVTNLIFSTYKKNESPNSIALSRAMFSQMSTLQNTTPYISDMYIYLFDSPYLYHSSGFIEPKTYFNNRYNGNYDTWINYLHPTQPFVLSLWELDLQSTAQVSLSALNVTKTIYNNTTPIGTIVINLKEDSLIGFFKENSNVIITDADDNIIINNLPSSFDSKTLGTLLDLDDNYTGTVSQIGLIASTVSPLHKLRYISVIPTSPITISLQHISHTINLLLIGISSLFILLNYKISKSTYRPIHQILNTLNTNSSSKLEDFKDESDYLQHSITSLINQNKLLESTVSSTKPFLNTTFLLNILVGGKNSTIDYLIEQYDLHLPEAQYTALVIHHELLVEQDQSLLTENNSKFLHTIENTFGSHLFGCVVTGKNEYTIALVHENQNNLFELPAKLPLLCDALKTTLPYYAFYIGLGDSTEDILFLHNSFMHAQQAILTSKIQSSSCYNIYTTSTKYSEPHFTDYFQQELMALLQKESASSVIEYIQKLLEKHYTKNVSYNTYIHLCQTINECLSTYLLLNSKESVHYLLDINPALYVYTADRLNDIVFYNLNRAVLNFKQLSDGPLLEHILNYVHNNFNRNINLSLLSDSLGYNSNYLSRYFKQATGINFTQYLNQCKITHAKKLILSSDMTIKEIGECSGFNSTNLFIKAFEQIEGTTPGKFRKQQQLLNG